MLFFFFTIARCIKLKRSADTRRWKGEWFILAPIRTGDWTIDFATVAAEWSSLPAPACRASSPPWGKLTATSAWGCFVQSPTEKHLKPHLHYEGKNLELNELYDSYLLFQCSLNTETRIFLDIFNERLGRGELGWLLAWSARCLALPRPDLHGSPKYELRPSVRAERVFQLPSAEAFLSLMMK